MTLPPNDISSLFSAPPSGPSQDVRYRQGVIVSFDPITLANEVLVDDAVLTDLPLLGVGEVTLLVPGAIVGLMVIGDGNRGKTMAILGRFVRPNTTDAENAVGLLNSQIYADFIGTFEAGPVPEGATPTDLATVGPEVTVPVSASGRVLIIASAFVFSNDTIGVSGIYGSGGAIYVWLSGANTYQPNSFDLGGFSQLSVLGDLSAGEAGGSAGVTGTCVVQVVLENLNPGDTTFTMKYQNAGGTVSFATRALTVIRL